MRPLPSQMSTHIHERMTPADVLVSTLPWIDRYTPRGPFDFVNNLRWFQGGSKRLLQSDGGEL